jgi:hypothetical protein
LPLLPVAFEGTARALPGVIAAGVLRLALEAVEDGRHRKIQAQREKIMRGMDANRPPIYQLQGREFRLDVERGTMTYLDEPGEALPLTVEVVHTKDQPDPGREPGKRRQRGRSL